MGIKKIQKGQNIPLYIWYWFTYIVIICAIWFSFIWVEHTNVLFLYEKPKNFLVDIARFFPGPDGKYVGLVDQGFADIAQNYCIFFSTNLIVFILFVVVSIRPMISDHNGLREIEKTSRRYSELHKIARYLFVLGFAWLLFLRSKINYQHETVFYDYEIHKGPAHYYLDLVMWICLFVTTMSSIAHIWIWLRNKSYIN